MTLEGASSAGSVHKSEWTFEFCSNYVHRQMYRTQYVVSGVLLLRLLRVCIGLVVAP